MANLTVIKRDGSKLNWDADRITRAVALAFFGERNPSVENTNKEKAPYGLSEELWVKAQCISSKAIARVLECYQSKVHIEQIQDIVEETLIAALETKVAQHYMNYRREREVHRMKNYGDNGLSDYISIAKYARYRADLGRRETFKEAARRVENMHREFFSSNLDKKFVTNNPNLTLLNDRTLGEALAIAFNHVERKEVLPSMRSLQFGGEAILRNNARLFNCSATMMDRVEAFREFLWLLLCGTGVGFSVQKHHIAKIPAFPARLDDDELPVEHYEIADTIEGWADALHALIGSFYDGKKIEFSFGKIRAKGVPLKTSGGKAPGHLPLKRALASIEDILKGAAGRHLKSLEAYDICMFSAKAVLSGGIRRSATICLFSADDDDMMNAKTGNWWDTHPQRSASNNSAVILRGKTTRGTFDKLFNAQKQFGEPGFYFSNSDDVATNPCVTADTWVFTSDGPRQVKQLIGKAFTAIVDGKPFQSLKGFFKTGDKDTIILRTKQGHSLELTPNHLVYVVGDVGRWVEAGKLKVGDEVRLNKHRNVSWLGHGTYEDGIKFAECSISTNAIESMSSEFYRGYLTARRSSGNLTNAKLSLTGALVELQRLQRMLGRLGVNCSITTGMLNIEDKDLAEFQYRLGSGKAPKAVNKHMQATVESSEIGSTKPVYDCTVETEHAFDANGFYVHNCVEIGLSPYVNWELTEDEKQQLTDSQIDYTKPMAAGVQFCNLTTINGGRAVTPEEFYRLCVWAAFIGTLQAAYNKMPYLSKVSELLNAKDRLLGVSICGIMDNPQVLLKPSTLRKGAQIVKETNEIVAKMIGIGIAARTTCVKPEGSTSLLIGSGSGIHPHHAKNYFRRVQANRQEAVYKHLKSVNPQMTEVSAYAKETDDVITFPVSAPDSAILRKDIDAVQFLEAVKTVQRCWVMEGTRPDGRNPGLHHNVSNTCTVKDNEWEEVREFIWSNREFFTGIALLREDGDKQYLQAPREEVVTQADIAKWNALNPEPVDYTTLMEHSDETQLKLVLACGGGKCEIIS